MAEVLVVREHCTPTDCAAFRSLTDSRRISANISEQTYEGLVGRYSLAWNAPAAPPVPPVAALVPGLPTGRPTNAEFPSAASTPPVSIMTAEPATTSASHSPAPSAATPTPSPRPTRFAGAGRSQETVNAKAAPDAGARPHLWRHRRPLPPIDPR